jgi:nucleoside recognition membrane protein YjiH
VNWRAKAVEFMAIAIGVIVLARWITQKLGPLLPELVVIALIAGVGLTFFHGPRARH